MSVKEYDIGHDTVLLAFIENAWQLVMVHIGDGDELGQIAQTAYALMKANYPEIFKHLQEKEGN